MSQRRSSLVRVYATPAAVVAMGALWMWGGLDSSFRGAILFAGAVIVISIAVGARSARKTRRRLRENERRLAILREGGLDALRAELSDKEDATKDAA